MFWNTKEEQSTQDNNLSAPGLKGKGISNEDLRMFEATEVASEVVAYDPDEPSAITMSSFDWENGRYFKGTIWVAIVAQLIFSIIVMVVSLVLSKKFAGASGGYSIWIKRPDTIQSKIEWMRAGVQIGIPALTYSVLQLIFCFFPVIAMMFAKILGKTCPGPATRLRINRLLKLRRSIGMSFFGIAAAVLSRRLYRSEGVTVDPQASEDSNPVLAFGADIANYLTKNNSDFFVNRFFLSFAVVSLCILAEKVFILHVGVMFHREGLAKREAANRFVRKITKALSNHFVKSHQAVDPKAPQAELIFDAIGKPKIGVKDLEDYMDADEAASYFFQLDEENGGIGELNREEFIAAVQRLSNEERAIEKALLGSSGLIGKLDSIMVFIVGVVSSVFILGIFEPPLAVVFSYIVSVLASLVFLFGTTAKEIFDSISYVIVNHPFDQDDWLLLEDGILYQVKDIGLMTSSFLTPQNDLVYMTNLSLAGQAVINLKRSTEMSEIVSLNILPDTPKEKIAQLESMLRVWLSERPHLFSKDLLFRDFIVTDSLHMKFNMRLKHRANFDDMTKKDHRSRLFMLYLRDAMQQLQIKASPPILPESVKPF